MIARTPILNQRTNSQDNWQERQIEDERDYRQIQNLPFSGATRDR